ncbi:MAG: DCC1-like thiol-disulfide oxidoreductase family protein [Nitratireductor sp.]
MSKKEKIWFVYDGECPICQMGADLYKLRQSVGELITVDARMQKDHPVMIQINQAQLNLDQGMVVKYKGALYQGEDALYLMAKLGAEEGWFNRVNNTLYKSKFLVKVSYPFMKSARNMALKFKGADKIRNLE